MDEAEWLSSTDPAAMLHWLAGHGQGNAWVETGYQISDRKLRLFLETGCPRCRENTATLSLERAVAYVATADCGTPKQKADLLRDIFGNPWQRVTHWIEVERVAGGKLQQAAILRVCGPGHTHIQQSGIHPDWLTWRDGIVVKLAQATYDERGHVCERCRGSGENRGPVWRPSMCSACHGTGTISDGTLDAGLLMKLADALEEAGCQEEAILRHLRGWEPCPPCAQVGLPHWRKVVALHVRGCWVLDLILGKG